MGPCNGAKHRAGPQDSEGRGLASFHSSGASRLAPCCLSFRIWFPHHQGPDPFTRTLAERFEKPLAFLACVLGLTCGKIQSEDKIKLLKSLIKIQNLLT